MHNHIKSQQQSDTPQRGVTTKAPQGRQNLTVGETHGQTHLQTKFEKLKTIISHHKKLAIAYSSGVDSTFLLRVAHDMLKDHTIAITARANWFSKRELDESKAFCEQMQIRQIIVDISADEIEGFNPNPPNRCYLCKRVLFGKIKEIATQLGMTTVAEGSNLDDLSDYRPGMQAIAELGIQSPLREAGLTKNEIRELSHQLGLETWDKPSFACLASRFVYGESITPQKLQMVEQAEQFLMSLGFRQIRVRIHGMMARIEVLPEAFDQIIAKRDNINKALKSPGFSYITLDLLGYRTGSMNELLIKLC